jgi:hypothetical protein
VVVAPLLLDFNKEIHGIMMMQLSPPAIPSTLVLQFHVGFKINYQSHQPPFPESIG